MFTPEKEHQDWLRFNVFKQTRKAFPEGTPIDTLIKEATKVEQWITNRPSASVTEIKSTKNK
jgi:hypothetical protein